MDFKVNNRYWLNQFIQDFIDYNKSFLLCNNTSSYDIDTFLNKFVYKDSVKDKDKENLINILHKYKSILSDCILRTKYSNLKYDIIRKFYNFIKEKDPDNQLDLNKIKFELVNLTTSSFPPFSSTLGYYLIVCDIDDSINFELIYGTLKVINKI